MTPSRSKSSKQSAHRSTKDKTTRGGKSSGPKPAVKSKTEQTQPNNGGEWPKKFDINQKLQAANNRLKGKNIIEYIDAQMGEDPDAHDQQRAKQKAVKDSVMKLDESYSVKRAKKLDVASQDPAAAEDSGQVKVMQFLMQGAPRVYATEDTPVEMSRCTSLSNLTIESAAGDRQDYAALRRKFTECQRAGEGQVCADDQRAGEGQVCAGEQRAGEGQVCAGDQRAGEGQVCAGDQRAGEGQVCADDQGKNEQAGEDVLDKLGKQIDRMTIKSRLQPGYVQSLPHCDEITKFQSEGSVGAHTAFSALTVDSDTKIAPTRAFTPDTELRASKIPRPIGHKAAPAKPPTEVVVDQLQHYSEEREVANDKPLQYKIEDTPLCLSGHSSLSSLDIDTDGADAELLKACISSAMPQARDLTPHPKELVPFDMSAIQPPIEVPASASWPTQPDTPQAALWRHKPPQSESELSSVRSDELRPGCDAKSLMRSKTRGATTTDTDARRRAWRGDNNQQHSGSGSSHHRRHRNDPATCMRCSHTISPRKPSASSTGKLAPTCPRHKTTSSSIYSTRHAMTSRMPTSRSRSVNVEYQPSVVQLYPPIKHLAPHHHPATHHHHDAAGLDTSSGGQGSERRLVKSATFTKDKPSPHLVRGLQQLQPAQDEKKQPKSKRKKTTLWKGLKKLLSPNEETKAVVEVGALRQSRDEQVVTSSSSSKARREVDSSTWSRKKRGGGGGMMVEEVKADSSSLSLSSSNSSSSMTSSARRMRTRVVTGTSSAAAYPASSKASSASSVGVRRAGQPEWLPRHDDVSSFGSDTRGTSEVTTGGLEASGGASRASKSQGRRRPEDEISKLPRTLSPFYLHNTQPPPPVDDGQ